MSDKRRALVTGGAVRIGAAICRVLARVGCVVVVHYRQSAEAAEALVDALKGMGGNAWAVQGELESIAGCDALFDAAVEAAGGPLTVLVNNASLFNKERLTSSTAESTAREFNVNFFAPMHLIRRLGCMCAECPVGSQACVVNLLDRRITGYEGGCTPYLLSKKSLAELTRVLAVELAPGVRVNGVAPGAILPPPGEGDDYLLDRAGTIPLRCQCTPESVADAVAYLIEAPTVTGQIIYVDGGQHLLGAGASVTPVREGEHG